MKKLLMILVQGLLIGGLPGCKTTAPIAEVKVDRAFSSIPYHMLLENVKSQSPLADFESLRLAYTDTDEYQPYTAASGEAVWHALNSKDYSNCLQLAAELLSTNYPSLVGHFTAMACHFELGQEKQGQYHRFVFNGLVDSIKQSGDGRTVETAYTTISTNELYAFLNILGLDVTSQSLVHYQGKAFDRMTVKDPQAGEEYFLFFDITLQLSKGMKF